jgi:hypothetical protein
VHDSEFVNFPQMEEILILTGSEFIRSSSRFALASWGRPSLKN